MSPQPRDPFQYLNNNFTTLQLRSHATLIYGLYVALAFGIVDAPEMISQTWEKTGVELRYSDIYASIRSNGELLKDVKQYAFAQVAASIPRYARYITSETLATALPVGQRNRVQYALEFKPLLRTLKAALADGREALSIGQMDRAITSTLKDQDIKSYMGKFINRKMAFILKSGEGQSFDHLMSDLTTSAFYGLLRTYPNWTDDGHRLAIAKTNIHNRGHNIIKEGAAQVRNPLQYDGTMDVYQRVLVSMDCVEDSELDALLGMNNGACADFDGASDHGDKVVWETMQSLRQLVNSPHLYPKQRQYLRLLLGEYDEDFSIWLGLNNTEAAEALPYLKYDGKVREYMGIPEGASKEFLAELRYQL